jgi:hypothetical protein
MINAMSALGQKQTLPDVRRSSLYPQKRTYAVHSLAMTGKEN